MATYFKQLFGPAPKARAFAWDVSTCGQIVIRAAAPAGEVGDFVTNSGTAEEVASMLNQSLAAAGLALVACPHLTPHYFPRCYAWADVVAKLNARGANRVKTIWGALPFELRWATPVRYDRDAKVFRVETAK